MATEDVLTRWRRRRDLRAQVKSLETEIDRVIVEYLGDWRKLCADAGPWRYAADIGAPPYADLATIAYLAVYHDLAKGTLAARDDHFIDEAVEHAVAGFDEYLLRHPEAVRPE